MIMIISKHNAKNRTSSIGEGAGSGGHKKENMCKNDNYGTSHEDERTFHYDLRAMGAMALKQKKGRVRK